MGTTRQSPFRHIPHVKKRALLAAYTETARVASAAKAADVDRNMHYHWLRDDPEYAKAFAVAQQMAAQTLEDEAVRRARDGVMHPVIWRGVITNHYLDYSDTLLIFLLKGQMPAKYGDRIDQRISGSLTIDAVDALKRLIGER